MGALQKEKAGTPKTSHGAWWRWSGWQPAHRSYGIGQDVARAGFGEPFCDALGASQPGRGAHVLGIWAAEVNLLQSTETSLLKYLPVRQLTGVMGETWQC